VKGPGDVKGKDIDTGAFGKVLNPDQHIATLDKKGTFKAELKVENGKGYVSVESGKDDEQSVDEIHLDSIFTPITKVNFWVEGARVGRSTDYDKLIMDIWTDGSISPPRALTQASEILRKHLSFFCLEKDMDSEDSMDTDSDQEGDNNRTVDNKNLLKSVEELELSVRSYNCLKNANISTIADLVQKTEQEMLRTKNFGRKSLNEIKEIISAMGLHLNMRVDQEVLQRLMESTGGEDAA
jgi:DNA-directed RNA polymerase subunit alpha